MEIELNIKDILEADNVAGLLDDSQKSDIYQMVSEGYEFDQESRDQNLKIWDKVNDLLKTDLSKKSYPFDGASNVNIPVLYNSCMTFAARAYPAIIRDSNIVKAKAMGDDDGKFFIPNPESPSDAIPLREPGSKQKMADRVSKFMNWQILYNMDNWEDEFDDLLNKLPAYGSMFKKIYVGESGKKKSELIYPQFLCVNVEAESIEKAERITQLFSLSRHEIVRNINQGTYAEFDYSAYMDEVEMPIEMIEQHTRIDLDGDGYPEPYIVVAHPESETIVAIYRRFEEVDIVYADDEEGGLLYINPIEYYVHYKFLPDPLGNFYGYGWGALILKLNNALNSLINQIIDSGHMSLMGGGFIGKGIRMRGGKIPIPMGKFIPVNASGAELSQNIVPMNFPAPSGVTTELFNSILQYTKNITGMRDVLEGQIRSDQKTMATLAQIENSLNEFRSIFKRIQRSMKREFESLYRLNANYPEFDVYERVMDDDETNISEDFRLDTYDIYPVADPSEITNIQRQMKSDILMELAQSGLIEMKPTLENYLQANNIADYEKYIPSGEPTNQDKQLQIELAKSEQVEKQKDVLEQGNKRIELAIKARESMASVTKDIAQAIDKLAQAEEREAGNNLDQYINELRNISEELRTYDEGQQAINEGMVSPSGNQGNDVVSGGSEVDVSGASIFGEPTNQRRI